MSGIARDRLGRFALGNRGGPGNPLAGRVAKLRAALLAAVKDSDLRAVMRKLIELAKAGEEWAIRELLERLIGASALLADPSPNGVDGDRDALRRVLGDERLSDLSAELEERRAQLLSGEATPEQTPALPAADGQPEEPADLNTIGPQSGRQQQE